MDLYLRKVTGHPQALSDYRVILKVDETEFEIGSIGVQTFTSTDTAWTWGIDTVIPMRSTQTEGRGTDRKDCMKQFRRAWETITANEGWLDEFLAMKRKRKPSAAPIETDTKKYERFHNGKPAGRKFWRFVLASDTITTKDHWLNLDDKQRTYPDALKEAQRVAGLRKSVRIIVEP